MDKPFDRLVDLIEENMRLRLQVMTRLREIEELQKTATEIRAKIDKNNQMMEEKND